MFLDWMDALARDKRVFGKISLGTNSFECGFEGWGIFPAG